MGKPALQVINRTAIKAFVGRPIPLRKQTSTASWNEKPEWVGVGLGGPIPWSPR